MATKKKNHTFLDFIEAKLMNRKGRTELKSEKSFFYFLSML